jgi:hypothetical protein
MKLTFAIETSKPCGATFRLAIGVTIPLALIGLATQLLRLF